MFGGAPQQLLAQFVAPGFQMQRRSVLAGAPWVGGLAILGSGNYALFDGSDVIEVDAQTLQQIRVLYTPPTFAFGAFLVLHPDRRHLYFGESSQGTIVEIDVLAGGTSRLVTQASLPFDLAFDSAGRAFLQWSPGFSLGSRVSLLDLNSGALDDLIVSNEASGPLALGPADELYLVVTETSTFPPPPSSFELRRFYPGQLNTAVGPGALQDQDGQLLALLQGGFDLEVDESGDLLVSDAYFATLVEVNPVTGSQRLLLDLADFLSATYLAYHDGGTGGHFAPYQPESAGEVVLFVSDFLGGNELASTRPGRPTLATQPVSPVPPGPVLLQGRQAPSTGLGLLLVSAGLQLPETAYPQSSISVPLFLGLDLSSAVTVVPVLLDSHGSFDWTGQQPGLGGATLGLQLVVSEGPGQPFLGTSAPLHLDLP
jgi:hypothetical protein